VAEAAADDDRETPDKLLDNPPLGKSRPKARFGAM
jgi:hypothetical protein